MQSPLFETTNNLFVASSLIGYVLVLKAGIQGIEWVFVMFSFKRKQC